MSSNYSDSFRLDQRVAIVTGGLGILGRESCKGLAEQGANIAVIDLNEQLAREFAEYLKENYRVSCIGVGCDVSSPESVRTMVDRVVEEFGEIKILHNNAATKSSDLSNFFAPFEDYTLSTWREVMGVNIDGMFLVSQAVGKQMIKQKSGGSIIQTASIYGVVAPDQRIYKNSYYLERPINTPAVYSVSKAGVIGLTKYLSTYWSRHNIRVNTLTPGGIRSGQNKEFQDNYSHRVPLNRMADVKEIIGAIIYLASDASNYVTGHNIIVDGGLSVW